ncbi:MAG TPA: hypothetical protein DCX07_12335, partial [Phycisphaerales bacterium]|nr:hypothetical protein [Phycisphaerales bacterium]
VGRRFTIVEDKVSHDCIFLSPGAKPGGGKGCRIYSVRPTQCRTWPFWSHNLASPHSWAMANLRCPGINRGPRFATDEIESRRQATRE